MKSAGQPSARRGEWFVPTFGPEKFRLFVGMLFLPYTGMVIAFTVIGSMLANRIYWDRVAAIAVIYFLALGIGAHALDAYGSKDVKPWGDAFSRQQLLWLAISSICGAYALGTIYMIVHAPLLWVIAIVEGFFLLAYNLEWFNGRFHTDRWFAFSWGFLPVLAGYVLQTNNLSAGAVTVALAMSLLSLVEIKASRPYKQLKNDAGSSSNPAIVWLESVLKYLSLAVVVLALGLLMERWYD